ncbi:hypothetical protein LR48_Vigan03g105700 [Vigna angularis]|uniref:Uncharacterized protein n=1 Tax=Phaseolus angularis TaxID=3914 RepID=A0A0L9U4G0_PHAAN|nr:hypothetical protein LR48_Vigan03g105700 [Vigna angularis]
MSIKEKEVRTEMAHGERPARLMPRPYREASKSNGLDLFGEVHTGSQQRGMEVGPEICKLERIQCCTLEKRKAAHDLVHVKSSRFDEQEGRVHPAALKKVLGPASTHVQARPAE